MSGPAYHGWTHRRKQFGGSDEIPGWSVRNIKVFADQTACDGNLPDEVRVVSTGDGKFVFQIDTDEDGYRLFYARAFVTIISSSGDITVQIRNGGQDRTGTANMLSTPLTIDAGDFSSLTSAAPPVIDTANDDVADGEFVEIDVDAAGTGAEGLGVNLGFRQP